MTRKVENTGFTCAACGTKVAPIANGTIRDHCPVCLCSLHVDNKPGDRANLCHGILRPFGADYHGKKGHIVLYRCDVCGQEKRNKLAPDDDFNVFISIQNQPPPFL